MSFDQVGVNPGKWVTRSGAAGVSASDELVERSVALRWGWGHYRVSATTPLNLDLNLRSALSDDGLYCGIEQGDTPGRQAAAGFLANAIAADQILQTRVSRRQKQFLKALWTGTGLRMA